MNVSRFDTRWLIQFWAPVNISGRQLLTSFHQSFASCNNHDTLLQNHRLHFERYACSIDDHVNKEEDDPMIKIIGGPVAMAFLNNFLEVVLNRNANDLENPLVHSALECKLSSSLFLPIFNCHPSSEIKHASCVDVIECSAMRTGSGLVRVLNELKSGLETIPSLKRARDEIKEALAVVYVVDGLGIAVGENGSDMAKST
ncbi:hypothetical protein Tco_0302752 [Tanacetum coccineum]